MFNKGDRLVRISVEREIEYSGMSPSAKKYPVGSEVTFKNEHSKSLFDICEPSDYYLVYGDWVLADFSLENE